MRQKSRSAWWMWAVGVVLLGLVSSGCPKKPAAPGGVEGGAAGPGGVREGEIPPGERVESRIRGGGEESPLQDIHFAYDAYDLSSEAREVLQGNARWLQGNSQAKVEIEGHCDARGTNEYNLALGAKRARTARDYLVTLGISSERLSTISYGEELPLCHEQTESCWQQNRRAHFLVLTR